MHVCRYVCLSVCLITEVTPNDAAMSLCLPSSLSVCLLLTGYVDIR